MIHFLFPLPTKQVVVANISVDDYYDTHWCNLTQEKVNMEKLKNYLDDNGIEYKWFSLKVGMSTSQFNFVLSHRRGIPAKYWNNIVKVTRGEITLQDLADYMENFLKK